MSPNEAYKYTHYFVSGVYYLPIFGAIIADGWLGKYRTILWLSIVYCLGSLTLACMDTSWGIGIGQRTMLAIGLGIDLYRLGRNQAVRLGQCRRPIRRIEQASALENVWLVLFFD